MNPLAGSRVAVRGPLIGALALVVTIALAAPAWAQSKPGKRKRRGKAPKATPASKTPAPDPGASTAEDSPATSESPDRDNQGKKKGKQTVFDFTGLQLDGSVRMPQLLYFLDRAQQELERASLERRSFVPELLKSLDEENL